MEQHFRIGRKPFTLWYVSGTVKGVTILSETKVYERSGRVGSSASHRREVWLRRADSGQDQLITIVSDFPVMEGQEISAVFLRSGSRNRLVYVWNDSAGTSQQLLWGALFMAEYRRDFGCCLGLILPPLLGGVLYTLHTVWGPDPQAVSWGEGIGPQPLLPSLDPWWYAVPAGLMAVMLSVNAWKRRRERLQYQEELARFLNAVNAVRKPA